MFDVRQDVLLKIVGARIAWLAASAPARGQSASTPVQSQQIAGSTLVIALLAVLGVEAMCIDLAMTTRGPFRRSTMAINACAISQGAAAWQRNAIGHNIQLSHRISETQLGSAQQQFTPR